MWRFIFIYGCHGRARPSNHGVCVRNLLGVRAIVAKLWAADNAMQTRSIIRLVLWLAIVYGFEFPHLVQKSNFRYYDTTQGGGGARARAHRLFGFVIGSFSRRAVCTVIDLD